MPSFSSFVAMDGPTPLRLVITAVSVESTDTLGVLPDKWKGDYMINIFLLWSTRQDNFRFQLNQESRSFMSIDCRAISLSVCISILILLGETSYAAQCLSKSVTQQAGAGIADPINVTELTTREHQTAEE